jgi:hypothetical protein
MWLPEGLRRSKVNSTAAHRRAVGIPDPIQTDLLLQSWQGSEIRKESLFTLCVRNYEVLHLQYSVEAFKKELYTHVAQVVTNIMPVPLQIGEFDGNH